MSNLNISQQKLSGPVSEKALKLASNGYLRNAACEGCATQHISLCSVLNVKEIKIFSEISTDTHKTAKQIICAEGEDAPYIFNIRTGAILLSKMLSDGRRQVTGFLFPGDFFGLACNNRYNYTAEAITDVDICRFPRAKILNSFKDLPKLGEKIIEITQTDLQSNHDQMLLLGRKNAQEKLCSFLLSMQEKSAKLQNKKTDDIALPMSRSDIADYLGLTIETISRQFTNLNKSGIITLDGAHKVFLKNPERLRIMAEGD